MFMKERKSLLAALLLVLFLSVYVNANAETIPDPPHYGIWILKSKSGKYIEIPKFRGKKVGAFCGLEQKAVENPVIDDLDGDELYYYFPEDPSSETVFIHPLNWCSSGGNPRAGGTYMVQLFVPAGGQGLDINFAPVKVINGVKLHKIIVDLRNVFSELIMIHNGVLTAGYVSNSIAFPFHRKMPEVNWGD